CQNYQISRQQNIKETISPAQLSFIMLKLQQQGAQNIDLVSPGHFMPQIVEAIYLARIKGLELPIVYNTNAYENINVIKFLSGIVDIYLPDVKYSNAYMAEKYSQVPDYPEIAFKAIVEMYKQCGGLIINEAGCAQSGVLVRHLVLPGKIAGSFEILEFLKYNISLDVGLSLMSQYAPCYQAGRFAELNRTITVAEYNEVVNFAEFLGFENCWVQAIESNAVYFPDFAGKEVF
ncbi:MAG: radical SAM protein, partial [Candidatus Omnitrophota bacterium]